MTAINVKARNDTTAQSPTQIANQSFDQTYQVTVVEPVVYNPVTATLDRMVQPGQTLPTSGLNGSLVLAYDGSGNLQSITKTINSVSYIKILSYTGSDLTGVSEWSLVA